MRPALLRPLFCDWLTSSGAYGLPLCSSGLTTLTSERRPGEVGLTLTSAMAYSSALFEGGKVDFLAGGEADIGLLPVAAPADEAPEALLLALDVGHLHRVDLRLEHQFDSRLDLRLGGGVGDAEYVLPALVRNHGALLGYHRREQHIHQLLR